jgi:hypothetical protein
LRCSPGTRRVLQGRGPRAQKRTRPPALRLCVVRLRCALNTAACAAPTRVPTGTAAPTNVGDTNPPTRAPTFVPTRGPNFADPTGTADARAVIAPSPCPLLVTLPRSLPPTATAHSIYSVGPSPGTGDVLHARMAHGTTACRGHCGTERVLRGTAMIPRALSRSARHCSVGCGVLAGISTCT